MYRVVVIDDHREISQLLRVVLRHPDIELHSAEDGREGLHLIREVQPDLIVLDVMLPGMNGWQVYDAVRADPSLQQTPIIVVTVVSTPLDRHHLFTDSPIDRYFTKPFDTLQLRHEIEQMLGGVSLWR